jgi:mannose-6-phosphate isomerase-like protein (cupin superfamily)
MTEFEATRLPLAMTETAPDGLDVRVLLRLHSGSMAHFELAPGAVSRAVSHRTVEEIWFVLSGSGELWRKQGAREEIIPLAPGVCLTVPLGTHFQLRATGAVPVSAIAVTMPPWPGNDEAVTVSGPWHATVEPRC